ncbi:hypothetical protein L3X38_029510 [Prunus dulcis]|uniref:Uncharacterized protein n=1 Tax=Prunus dulcis TaxID=3755 RepID=A0AAD4Z322_PRUDU|nr:hypothetical protein L3X38_029510 [Prunus dulcis]
MKRPDKSIHGIFRARLAYEHPPHVPETRHSRIVKIGGVGSAASKQAAKFEPLYHLQNLDRLRFVQQKTPL